MDKTFQKKKKKNPANEIKKKRKKKRKKKKKKDKIRLKREGGVTGQRIPRLRSKAKRKREKLPEAAEMEKTRRTNRKAK